MTAASKLRAIGQAADDGFFGTISMLREFWAEDPSWTNPGDGNDLTTWRDNGSIGSDLVAGRELGTDNYPTFVSTGGINSRPAIRFDNPSVNNGGYMSTVSTATVARTIVAVAKFDTASGARHITDSTSGNRSIIRVNGGQWEIFEDSADNALGGTPDTNPHLFAGTFIDNSLVLYVDEVAVATDPTSTIQNSTGFILGCHQNLAANFFDGEICYVAAYDGDLTAHADYDEYIQNLRTYYGI